MQIASTSIRRFAAVHTTSLPAFMIVRCLSRTIKKVPRAKQTYSPPALSLDNNKISLSKTQAIGTVATIQPNYIMRVIIQFPGEEPSGRFLWTKNDNSSRTRIGTELLCVARKALKMVPRAVLVGDKVLVGTINWVDRTGRVDDVFERISETIEPPVANVDHLLVLFSFDQPKPKPVMITRFLVEAESIGIPVTLALNKSELVDEETILSWKSRLRSWGYEPIFCSVESKHGLEALAFILREQTTVIVGPSGVGKSSLINALRKDRLALGDGAFLGSKLLEEQRVREVSTRNGRGKNTTSTVSLLPLSKGGYLADTPGFELPSLWNVTKNNLAQAFPEIQKILNGNKQAKCLYNNCLHFGTPGCIVEGDWERYPHYFNILQEMIIKEKRQIKEYGTKNMGYIRYNRRRWERRRF